MNNDLYSTALSFFKDGKYVEAYSILSDSATTLSSKEAILLDECKKQITNQYNLLIRDCIQQGDWKTACSKKEEYCLRYDFDSMIRDIQIPMKAKSYLLRKTKDAPAIIVVAGFLIVLTVILIVWKCSQNDSGDIQVTNDVTSSATVNEETVGAADYHVVDSTLETPPEEIEKPYEPEIQFEHIKEKRGNFEVDIEWPVSMSGTEDVSKLQECIIAKAFGYQTDDIHKCIELYFERESEEAENNWIPEQCDGHKKVKFHQWWNGLCIFSTHYLFYGGGNSESIFSSSDYIIYDKDSGRELKLDDIISNKPATLNIIKDYLSRYNTDRTYCEADEVPERFQLSPLGITFIFPQYTIWGGSFGEPHILFDYYELKDALSDSFAEKISNILHQKAWIKCSISELDDARRLDFERKGNKIRNCIYSNLNTDEKIEMTGEIVGNNYIFEAKDGSKALKIMIDRHVLEGTIIEGSKEFGVQLEIEFP